MISRKVYVAGCLTPRGKWSSNPAVDYLINAKKMIQVAVAILKAGYTPFCPALDMLYFLAQDGNDITEEMIKEYSLRWLEACDDLVLVEGWEGSAGTKVEIDHANKHGVRVFESLKDFLSFYEDCKHKVTVVINEEGHAGVYCADCSRRLEDV